MRTSPEPYKIKSVEPISLPPRERREAALAEARLNLFKLSARDVFVDLLTDSGTSAMSAAQWAGILDGDESYAGARSFERFESAVKSITGMPHIIPTHQGRAAEFLLFSTLVEAGACVPGNTHFDTTRANVEARGARALDFPSPEAEELASEHPFKGNVDLAKMEDALKKEKGKIPFALITVTNNSVGGQPVSLANLRAARSLCDRYGIPLFLDAARFAENAYFVKTREPGYAEKSISEIAADMFALADGCTMSAKKDALVNIGGFIALRDAALAERVRARLILTEGFPTYGGLAGRDLEAIAQGLKEVLDFSYLRARVGQVERFGARLREADVPILTPVGGHAVFVEAAEFLPHIKREHFPGQALAVALYREGGVRACEIGGVMFAREEDGHVFFPKREFVRLAVPRRVYTDNHLAYVADVFAEVAARKKDVRGVRIVAEPPFLRHFTAAFAWA